MKQKIFQSALVSGFAAFGFVASAHGATMQAIQGDNVVFYYDADYWGANVATVSGDSISFALASDFGLSVATSKPTGTPSASFGDSVVGALVVVAKNGYSLTTKVNYGVAGSANLAAGGYAYGHSLGSVTTGVYQSGVYTGQIQVGSYSVSPSSFISGNLGSSDVTLPNGQTYSVLGLSSDISISLRQNGAGASSAHFDSVNFGVTVAPVPEPETYGMLLGGLALLGIAVRRKASKSE